MPTSSLLKSYLHNSIAEGLYNEIQNRSARYYYFLGKTIEWVDDANPPYPIDSFQYELETRNEIITVKEIKSTDVAFVIPRVDWVSGNVYDMYDEEYSDQLIGINLISGGFGYSDPPTVTIIGGGGVGAQASCVIIDGSIVSIELTSRGRGYTSAPTINITGGGGEGGYAEAVILKGYNGAQRLEDINSVVITDEFNVYKCLDNNKFSQSTYKPIGTVVDPVIMPDGYMWKYMYSIPIALRNKFLTDAYMPVINSLRSQFYSNGEILNTVIQSSGKDYTFANIVVQGDGYRSSDPLLLGAVNISNPGSGYTSGATMVVDPPFSGANLWVDGVGIILGQKIEYNNNLYECTVSGVLGSPGPVHKSGIAKNGTSSLKYIGTRATGTVTVVGGQITDIIMSGSVYEINMSDGGEGYTSAPTVQCIDAGTGFVGSCIMRGTSVARVVILDSGELYDDVPVVVFGTEWESNTTYSTGDQIYYSNRLYTVSTGGTTSTTPPTHTTGTVTDGTAQLTYAGRPASGTAVLKYGSGYSSLPQITIQPVSGGGAGTAYFSSVKSEAKLIPILDSGQIVGVQIDDGGIGYTYANITVQGDGQLAEITADLSPGDLDTLQANTELLTPDGRIMAYPIISGGYGYGVPPNVIIDGDGVGAEAEAVVENGAVTKINVLQYGTGYKWATVTLDGIGNGATARAVRAPYGGHGKDPVNGTFSRTLMFYTNISKDTNQGFNVNNDFRQLGIIKNPREFATDSLLKTSLASACYVVTGNLDTVIFTQDMTVYLGEIGGRRFRIVAITPTGALLQSLDNAIPLPGSTFINDNAETFSATGVSAPTMNKYSGDILFIDNKQSFTPTADQTVTLRTVIKF